ncbi:HlyD family secretion protein [Idiomarina xiamenensis]|uniref:HlyD family multidrug efflux protein n=1 Tax=Idiomarina xiamenensis 10-D-4 TaxID=740709 RepID=K2JPI2_9GAMM|nr:HlyD family secretion protein [Idiomarina xiamenensis]EKE85421.1 HlyD family multidrug efflux protein [Idiomarina xiamenensis 10-D-4]
MSADQQFARWVRIAMAGFILLFGYFLLADSAIPLTPQAMVTRVVTQVAPQVSGPVSEVPVQNNQDVEVGDTLFRLDPQPYRLAVQQAELALQQARRQNQQLDAQVQAAEAALAAAQVKADEQQREAKRINGLYADGSASQQQLDQAQSLAQAARADVRAAQASVAGLQVQRGERDDEQNLRLQQAQNALAQAQLNLAYTQVKAEHAGQVSNLQLRPGAYARAGTPVMALVANDIDIVADFREKNLRQVQPGQRALLVFDSQPGVVYEAEVSSIDAGVGAGQLSANGSLANPVQSNRWVRDAQRLRVHLTLQQAPQTRLAAGSKATVQLVPDNGLLAALASAQIHVMGWLHYIY